MDCVFLGSRAPLPVHDDACDVAVLPYWPVWAAAQLAATSTKEMLRFVHVWQEGDVIQVEAVGNDGHRAMRYRMPVCVPDSSGGSANWFIPDGGLLLLADPLKKAVAYACYLRIASDLTCYVHGGKVTQTDLIGAFNVGGFYGVHHATDCASVGASFPKLNALWPDSFTYAPGGTFCFDSDYLADWARIVTKTCEPREQFGAKKTSDPVMRFRCNTALTPFHIESPYSPRIGLAYADAILEHMLMPIQHREQA